VARKFDEAYDDVWRYERFITTIEQRTGVGWDRAEHAARAALETLGERISGGQARDLARDLPSDVRRWLLDSAAGDAEAFDATEFVRRVAEREGVDTDTAEQHARAVFVAVARLVPGREFEQMVAELPRDYRSLIGDALGRQRDPAGPEVVPEHEFLDRVGGRAGLDAAAAERAAEAVLETLGERIAGGEADDIASVLPGALRGALERGRASTRGKARKMSLDEFVGRIADREGVAWEDALEHARAVFTTLREALPDKEWSDLLDELPRGYQEALLQASAARR
jgi:uncharacterized protein (DUF2267 family)